jgi:glycosyltransferase involved in cell wall biosynthesis
MTPGRLPIFILSFNRGHFLRRVIDSYLRQTPPIDIIIHDNGSDDPATLEILAELARQGVAIRYHAKIDTPDGLERVDRSIDHYFGWFRRRRRYVVTDCDIDLSAARADALEVYGELLDRFPAAECVGPMLRIADIPRDYRLFNHVMNRHIEQFWHRRPVLFPTRAGECAYIPATIDTTFALHREGSRFKRLRQGIRVYHPFEAQHLDWYPAAGQEAYRDTSSAAISHWNNAAQFEAFAGEGLRFERYTVVETGAEGGLVVRERRVLE